MTSKFLIYGLIDPRTDEVRYIGLSTSGLRRPRYHARDWMLRHEEHTHKARWIRRLQTLGLAYRVEVLEEVFERRDLADVECFWIAQAKGLGWRITNNTRGGEGVVGCVWSPEQRKKLSEQRKGRKGKSPSEETRRKIAAALLGKKIPREVIEKILLARKGYRHSNAARMHQSAARGGRLIYTSTGQAFISQRDAARVLGVGVGSVSRAINERVPIKGVWFGYEPINIRARIRERIFQKIAIGAEEENIDWSVQEEA